MFTKSKEANKPRRNATAANVAQRVKLVSFALSIIAAILIILVLTAGSSPSTLPRLHLIKASTPLLPVTNDSSPLHLLTASR